MPKASDYMSASSTLKAVDLKGRPHKVRIAGVKEVIFKDGEKPKAVLQFDGKEKGLTLNVTKLRILSEAFGDDMDEWAGREIEICPDKTMFGTDLVDCINVRVVNHQDDGSEVPF